MIFRLLLYIIPLIIAGFTISYITFRKLLLPTITTNITKKLAAQRAEFVCSGCNDSLDPNDLQTIYDYHKWWHKKCLRKLLNP